MTISRIYIPVDVPTRLESFLQDSLSTGSLRLGVQDFIRHDLADRYGIDSSHLEEVEVSGPTRLGPEMVGGRFSITSTNPLPDSDQGVTYDAWAIEGMVALDATESGPGGNILCHNLSPSNALSLASALRASANNALAQQRSAGPAPEGS